MEWRKERERSRETLNVMMSFWPQLGPILSPSVLVTVAAIERHAAIMPQWAGDRFNLVFIVFVVVFVIVVVFVFSSSFSSNI